MKRTRIKCCGITRVEDALLAARLGVDAIGLVFTPSSRRCIALSRALEIRRALPPLVDVVALFMDDEPALIEAVVETLEPDWLQFHGDEREADCRAWGKGFFKAVAMGDGAAALARLGDYPHAAALLLDGHASGTGGGSGMAFDWNLVPRHLPQAIIVAGGLDADNVAAAIRAARPWAVDVSSGIESAPGIKDPARMIAFVDAVRRVDLEQARAD